MSVTQCLFIYQCIHVLLSIGSIEWHYENTICVPVQLVCGLLYSKFIINGHAFTVRTLQFDNSQYSITISLQNPTFCFLNITEDIELREICVYGNDPVCGVAFEFLSYFHILISAPSKLIYYICGIKHACIWNIIQDKHLRSTMHHQLVLIYLLMLNYLHYQQLLRHQC